MDNVPRLGLPPRRDFSRLFQSASGRRSRARPWLALVLSGSTHRQHCGTSPGNAHPFAGSSLGKLVRRRNFYPRRIDHPILRRSRPIVPGDREPVRIIQCPTRNPTCAGTPFNSQRHRRPTRRAKFESQPPVTFVGTVFIGVEDAARDFHVFLIKIHYYPKGTSGPPLTKRTMANPRHILIPSDSITNCPTQTPTFMCVIHFGIPLLSANY